MTELIWTDWWLPVVAGPFVGSFLGVLVTRLPAAEPVIAGRSRCPHCAHPLGPRDLVPLASWLASGGRCRYCSRPLGLFYPAIELAAALVAGWAALIVTGWPLWATCALGWTLLALAVLDQRHLVLPDELTLPLLVAGLIVAYLLNADAAIDHAIGAAAGFAALFVLATVYKRVRGREGLGLGDAKLLAAAGAWVSWTGLASVVLVASATALIVVLARTVFGRRVAADERIPFGPYLCLATWLVWLYGPLVL
jgi:leader peptidase (prepilin peptidase)/N-methyltransferase